MYENGEQNAKNQHYGQQQQIPRDLLFKPEIYQPIKRDDAQMIAMLEDIQNRISRLEAALLPNVGSPAR